VSGLASGDLVAAAAGALVGAVGGAVGPWVIARLPEPELEPEPEGGEEEQRSRLRIAPVHTKTLYADLARRPGLAWRLAVAAAVVGAILGGALGWSADLLVVLPVVPVGVWLAYVDWRTTFLPTRIIAPTYAVVVLAVLVGAVVEGDRTPLIGAVAGWACYGGYFLLMWIISPGFGYGDVRLSGVLGLVLGWLGWRELIVGMFAGLLLTALLGLLLTLLRVVERGRNPAGPHLLAGAALAVVLGSWIATQLGY
jgi:leader peptidase (prepilin peptidase) / N-methyltransferase